MFPSSASVVLGYRWITFGGKQACEQCAALNGREFYRDPAPGQASVADMPHPPLHPNCGCKLLEIVDVTRAGGGPEGAGTDAQAGDASQADDPGIKPYMRGLVVRDPIFGALWRKKAVFKGPVYRKYGGLQWTAGKDLSDGSDEIKVYPPAEDDMDEIFKQHDLCYKANGKNPADEDEITCDRRLLEGLNSLNEDPRQWRSENKMTPREVQDAINYRRWAGWIFREKVNSYLRELRDSNEWGYDVEGQRR